MTSCRLLKIMLVLAAVLLQPSVLAETLTYTGEELRSEETGLSISPKSEAGWFVVASMYHRYSLVLPGVETWEFEASKEVPLRGTSKRFSVSLDIVPKGDQRTAKKKLTSILEKVQTASELEVRNPSYPKLGDQLALRYEIRFKAPSPSLEGVNDWTYTYWTVKPRGDSWFVLHFTPPPPPPPNQDNIPKIVYHLFRDGFRSDFDVK